ncbi:MAG: sensor protein [Gemmatimonadetes bacterium]|nr:sensor protein [Gemmatimonadota bacterium]
MRPETSGTPASQGESMSSRHATGAIEQYRVTHRDSLFDGAGEMRERCRSFDWSDTPLGRISDWPQSLRTSVQIALASPRPAIVLWGAEHIQVYNDGYRELMGLKHPAGLGQPTRECWPEVWHINAPIYEQVYREDTVFIEDALFPVARSGQVEDAWFSVSYTCVRDEAGSVGGMLVHVQETTSRVRSGLEREQLLAELSVERIRIVDVFQHAPSFIAIMVGPSLRFESANEAFQDLVGRRELIGCSLLGALPEGAGQRFVREIELVMESGEPWVGHEVEALLQREAGKPPEARYLDVVFHAMLDAGGLRYGVVAHGSDVTERVLARHAIELLLVESERARADAVLARREAEAASRTKGQFLNVMSHELRTPLNAIGGYAELLSLGIRGPVTAAQLEDLRRITVSQRHLLGLINEVLDYAKLENGGVAFDTQRVSARDAMSAAETLLATQARAKGVSLTSDTPSVDVSVLADGSKLRQVLANLLSNAIKFTDRGGRIDFFCTTDPRTTSFVVRDSGIGIAPEELERVFEAFVQVSADLARSQEGTGLGLAISRELARGMGGELSVHSKPGVGSTFTLTLPRD